MVPVEAEVALLGHLQARVAVARVALAGGLEATAVVAVEAGAVILVAEWKAAGLLAAVGWAARAVVAAE